MTLLIEGATWRRVLHHDFNAPRNGAGYLEVMLDAYTEAPKVGDEIVVRDDDCGIDRRGKVVRLFAVIDDGAQP